MRNAKRCSCVAVVGLLVFHAVFSSYALAQEAVEVMTLADGTKVVMTQAQLAALVSHPGISYYINRPPELAYTQMAIPVPTALGGGFIVGESAAIAVGMNAVGITSDATGRSVAGGTAAAGGAIMVGAARAGVAAAGGIGAGTIAIIGVGLAVVVGLALAAGGGGGGGGGGAVFTNNH